MLWLIIVLIIIFFAFGAAGIRAALKVGAVLLFAFIVLLVGYWIHDSMKREASKKRIAFSEVQFTDLRLAIGTTGKLTGTVRNGSQRYTLTDAELEITVRDCTQSGCDVVGQESTHLWSLNVPPGQVRAVDESVYFSNLPPRRGEYQWDYKIKSVEGH
jgi:uncharacterized protein (DUF58 family)